MRWRLVAIPASLVPIAVIAVQFDIGAEDVLAVGAYGYALAVGAMGAKLAIQGAKFAYIARSYIPSPGSVASLMGVRVGSEFIKFTTPMFVGAEVAVIYWLHKRGVPASRASWVAIMDIVTEVMAAGAISIVAGVIALAAGAYALAALILGTSVAITGVWTALFFLSSRRVFGVPRVLARAALAVGGGRAERYVEQANSWMGEVCAMSREHMGSAHARRVFGVSLAASLASWAMYGVSFAAITVGLSHGVGVIDSIMAVMGANAVGNLPITVGGSGIVELGVASYLDAVGSAGWAALGGALEWSSVIGWRIATYYVPIAITWILLVRFALARYKRVDSG